MMNRFEWNSFNVNCSTFCHEILISICNEFIPYLANLFWILISSGFKSSPPLFFTELRSDSIKFLGQREDEGGDLIWIWRILMGVFLYSQPPRSIFSSLTAQIWLCYLLLFSPCVVVPWWAIAVDTSCIFFQYSYSCENGTNVYFWLLSIVVPFWHIALFIL